MLDGPYPKQDARVINKNRRPARSTCRRSATSSTGVQTSADTHVRSCIYPTACPRASLKSPCLLIHILTGLTEPGLNPLARLGASGQGREQVRPPRRVRIGCYGQFAPPWTRYPHTRIRAGATASRCWQAGATVSRETTPLWRDDAIYFDGSHRHTVASSKSAEFGATSSLARSRLPVVACTRETFERRLASLASRA